jgi:hypothetical protein
VAADSCQEELLEKEAERVKAESNLNKTLEKYNDLVPMPSPFFLCY